MSNQQPTYPVYRGLQKPLVFKSFKGRYIYWGLGSILAGLLSAMLVSSLVNIITGIITMALKLGIGLGITAWFQERGTKKRYRGISILPNQPMYNPPIQ